MREAPKEFSAGARLALTRLFGREESVDAVERLVLLDFAIAVHRELQMPAGLTRRDERSAYKRIEKSAAALLELLRTTPYPWLLAATRNHRAPSRPSSRPPPLTIRTYRERLESSRAGLSLLLEALEGLQSGAAEAASMPLQRGPQRATGVDELEVVLIEALEQIGGLRRSSAGGSKMVRATRLILDELGIQTDARDFVRRALAQQTELDEV